MKKCLSNTAALTPMVTAMVDAERRRLPLSKNIQKYRVGLSTRLVICIPRDAEIDTKKRYSAHVKVLPSGVLAVKLEENERGTLLVTENDSYYRHITNLSELTEDIRALPPFTTTEVSGVEIIQSDPYCVWLSVRADREPPIKKGVNLKRQAPTPRVPATPELTLASAVRFINQQKEDMGDSLSLSINHGDGRLKAVIMQEFE